MIGLIAKPEEHELAREFFELFKTPWEFYRPEERYDVVLCASEEMLSVSGVEAKLIVVYAGNRTHSDCDENAEITTHREGGMLLYRGERFPVYGPIVTFHDDRNDPLVEEEQSRQSACVRRRRVGGQNVVRVGYDLFHELRFLLSVGQPQEYAVIPTVEIHIGLLRDLIVESGITLIEIPPIPEGHAFIACLTHDVDHPSIRRHKWDHTIFGFLYRAVIGSLVGVLKGRVPVRHLLANWTAVAKLPFIYLGLATDIWSEFDRYLGIEKDIDSTFFVLPFKDRPGQTIMGTAPRFRASSYGVADIAEQLHKLIGAGREIGVHGIDAWIDVSNGREEQAQIKNITGAKSIGVRMHWLYFNEESPITLERAGFSYDSTVGYNETIGYRSGTGQVYKPLGAHHLLELPLHVMDTALFYPGYLNCSVGEAGRHVGVLIDNAIQFGGVITFNWHDRSLAPERLWGGFYTSVISDLKQKGVWCTSAGRAVGWFRNRRAVVFQKQNQGLEVIQPKNDLFSDSDIPGLRLRIYNARSDRDRMSKHYIDSALGRKAEVRLDLTSVVAHS